VERRRKRGSRKRTANIAYSRKLEERPSRRRRSSAQRFARERYHLCPSSSGNRFTSALGPMPGRHGPALCPIRPMSMNSVHAWAQYSYLPRELIETARRRPGIESQVPLPNAVFSWAYGPTSSVGAGLRRPVTILQRNGMIFLWE